MKTKEDKLLERAKFKLMLKPDNVFYVSVLCSLKTVWTDKIKTAAVDGRNLFLHAPFFLSLNEEERMGVLMHEVEHVARNHITRLGHRNPRTFNEAGDYLINHKLQKSGFTLPKNCLFNPDYCDENFHTEGLYKKLDDEHQQNTNKVVINVLGDDIQYPADSNTGNQIEQEIGDIICKAVGQAKAAGSGNIPGEALIEMERIMNPKLPWNVILQNYMSQFAKGDYSWSHPNRRYLPEYYLPSTFAEGICNLAIAVDTSGSVSDSDFNYFISEIAEIQERLKPELMTVIDFDTKINSTQEVHEGTDIFRELKFSGRGGTNIKETMAWACEHDPKVMLVFTDGDFRTLKPELYPSCSLVWLIHGNPEFVTPHGEVIHYDIKN